MTLVGVTKANGWKLVEKNSGSTRAFPDNGVVQQENGCLGVGWGQRSRSEKKLKKKKQVTNFSRM